MLDVRSTYLLHLLNSTKTDEVNETECVLISDNSRGVLIDTLNLRCCQECRRLSYEVNIT